MKTITHTILAAMACLLSLGASAQMGTGQIKGYVNDEEYLPVQFATVKITQGGLLVGGTTTGEDGKYSYKPLSPGLYEVVIMSTEFPTNIRNNVQVNPEKTAYVDFQLKHNSFGTVTVTAEYVAPVVDQSVYTMQSINADQYLHMPRESADIKGAVINMISDGSQDANGDLHIRGSRGNATEYIVDGVRCYDMNGVPALSVQNVSVITGGIPAQYGDLTSGVVIVTTKDYFSGIREKRMRQNAYYEEQARIKREQDAKAKEEQRKKEIEKEQLEEQQSTPKAEDGQ